MNGLNGIIIDFNVYIPEESEKPCANCDLKSACQHGMLVGRVCGVFLDENESFRFSQELTDKLKSNGFQQKDTSASL